MHETPEISLSNYITPICPRCHIKETLNILGIMNAILREHIKNTIKMPESLNSR